MPDRPLAVLAGQLRRRGHDVSVRDYAGLDGLERARRHHGALKSLIRRELGAERGLAYIVLQVESPLNLAWVQRLAAGLSKGEASPTVVVWTRFAWEKPRKQASYQHWQGAGIAGLAQSLDRLACGDGFLSGPELGGIPEGGSMPDYSAEVYPAVHSGALVRIFRVAEITKNVQNVRSATVLRQPSRDTGVASVIREVKSLSRTIGTYAFHIECAASGAAERLALAIQTNGLSMAFVCRGNVNCFPPQQMGALHASGCRAVSVRAFSGSQRLLEDVYGVSWNVSMAERVIRSCRFEDLYTVTEFDGPSASFGDAHTWAETERLVRRSSPNSVLSGSTAMRGADRVSGDVALMASLAGHGGDEAAFARMAARQFARYDLDALRATVERINGGAAAIGRVAETPFTVALRDAIGN